MCAFLLFKGTGIFSTGNKNYRLICLSFHACSPADKFWMINRYLISEHQCQNSTQQLQDQTNGQRVHELQTNQTQRVTKVTFMNKVGTSHLHILGKKNLCIQGF